MDAAVNYPSFIDLRACAAAAAPSFADGPAAIDEAFLRNRRLLPIPPGPLEIGCIVLPRGTAVVEALSADEFLIVGNGAVTLAQDGVEIRAPCLLQLGEQGAGREGIRHLASCGL